MRLLVVTATRGVSPFWGETVASVRQAAGSAVRHVVVCPQDRIDMVRKESADLIIVSQERPGLYPKLNQGWRSVDDWDVFTWINDDDVLKAPGVTEALAVMERDASVDFVYGRVELLDTAGRRLGEVPLARSPADLADLMKQDIMPLAQPGTLIRRTALERLGGLDESFVITGDLDLFARALADGMTFRCCNVPVASFRLQAGQLSKRVAAVAEENRRSLSWIQHIPSTRRARWRFRLQNLPHYAERIRQHGFKSMRQIYDEAD